MPVTKPIAIAKKMLPMSPALPGMERKRTKLKAPATAMPAPMLPFTSMITICTIDGRSASATTKFLLYRPFSIWMQAMHSPNRRDAAVQRRTPPRVNCAPITLSVKRSSTGETPPFAADVLQDMLRVTNAVLGE